MAASSIFKWQNSLQRASRLVDTMRLLFILKWQYSLLKTQVARQTYGGFFYLKMAWLTSSWNFVFNWIFDKLVPGDRLERGPVIRTIHAVLFEGLFMFATVPIIMYMMHMSFWMAFVTDITMTLVILGYTYVYNWVYDRARLYFVEA